MRGSEATWTDRVRGLVLGLALGDSVGRGTVPPSGPLRAGVSTQLAAFTIEGIIRALVRGEHRGICHPPSVVWHAYCRWAALQGIEVHEQHRHWANGSARWPDGWLADVSEFRERRGSAPATVLALNRPEQGSTRRPTTHSRGCHALTRSLPLAALSKNVPPDGVADLAQDVAALTHGDPQAYRATAAAALLTGRCLATNALGDAVESVPELPRTREPAGILGEARTVCAKAREEPRSKARLAEVAPDATAPSALLGGLYVAAVSGALLGALYGVGAWPVRLLGRLESVWVMDTLARDLASQLTESPSGSAYEPAKDPSWLTRYPGW
ncbi:ADP-ribosylglycohydrolase family protein [Nonomuraea sp. SBT364]|uniref:ADP-ribosylglycohydrolase family protein n=1 Tax=Nonomuraea sp. SBT364 TaxID=1580530 RepID=UPI00066A946D|nr:ADP-ribosylglycohydrolase family protein [Nonomuraea sp. SBT364]